MIYLRNFYVGKTGCYKFDLMLEDELDPNSTMSTSVFKVSEISSGASELSGAFDAAIFPS